MQKNIIDIHKKYDIIHIVERKGKLSKIMYIKHLNSRLKGKWKLDENSDLSGVYELYVPESCSDKVNVFLDDGTKIIKTGELKNIDFSSNIFRKYESLELQTVNRTYRFWRYLEDE